MSKDFAKRNAAPNRRTSASKSKQVPTWLWFVAGAICGAFAMALVFTLHTPKPVTDPNSVAEKPVESESKTPKPRFDFYKLLQESEQIVPATETMGETEKAPENPANNIEYILQVGSFPNQTEADKLRAQLILLNLDAHIESVEIHKGEIWHRVVVGPFSSQEKLASARSSLVANQYTALVLKRAKNGKK
ncbi:MAG: carbamoyl-phosphate synthase small subunit [Gammaproteobacteria bacterium]|nr:MAG: carbamoyl-phosphate synthase small subunit [Gammaproteobacteria bacterium]